MLWIGGAVDDGIHSDERLSEIGAFGEIAGNEFGANWERDLRAAAEGAHCMSSGEQQTRHGAT
jgi:hypothetical protein